MTLWVAVLAAGVLAYLVKLGGYLVPERVLEVPWVDRVVPLLTVALLSSLVVTQGFLTDGTPTVDARAAPDPRPTYRLPPMTRTFASVVPVVKLQENVSARGLPTRSTTPVESSAVKAVLVRSQASCAKRPATVESTPPLIPRTRARVLVSTR